MNLVVVTASALALTVGFFVGREEMKYEMRTALQEAAQSFVSALSGGPQNAKPATPKLAPPDSKPQSPLIVVLKDKGFIPANVQKGTFQAFQTISISVQNSGPREIRAFSGTLNFTDLLDAPVYSINITIDDPVPAKGSLSWDGNSKFNEFIEPQVRFRNMPMANLKMSFAPKKVLYADGASETFE